MVLGSHRSYSRIKKRFILLLVFIPLFLLFTSFFVYVAAQENMADRDVAYWRENSEKLISEYKNDNIVNDVAGTVQLTENYVLPFYSSADVDKEGAFLFGNTLPGDAGRSIILGHNEQGFYYLSKLNVGDEIIIESYNGEHKFAVSSVYVCVPSEIPLERADESILTLVSKYPFASFSLTGRRYVVEAELIK